MRLLTTRVDEHLERRPGRMHVFGLYPVVSCSQSCILAFEGGYTYISVFFCILMYPDVYLNVCRGYNRIHEDTMYFMYPAGPNTDARTRIHRVRTEYSILKDTRRIH